jgi:glutaredoxin 3
MQNQIVIYSKTFCPYSNETKLLFKEYGIKAKIVELDLEPEGEALHAEVREISEYDQTPNIFIAGKHIGGYQDIENAFDSGRLVILLNEAGVKHTIGDSIPLYVEDAMIVEYFGILKDSENEIEDRMDALFSLKQIDDIDAVHVLIESFKIEKNSELLKHEILYCLGQMNHSIGHNV